jgi:endonuclease/exonuclease/phosphatase family metal-dependent hydrolase
MLFLVFVILGGLLVLLNGFISPMGLIVATVQDLCAPAHSRTRAATQQNGAQAFLNNRLVVVVYNVHDFRRTLASLKVGLAFEEDARRKAIAKHLEDSGADAIGLVEVWHESAKRFYVDALKRVYPFHYNNHGGVGWIQHGNGLLMLSKYPLDGHFEQFHASNMETADWFCAKGFYDLHVRLPSNLSTRFILTHLQAENDDRSAAVRVKQLQQIQRRLVDTASKYPSVVLGDLNLEEQEMHLLETFESFQDVANSAGNTFDTNNNTFALSFYGNYPARRYDVILASQHWECKGAAVRAWKFDGAHRQLDLRNTSVPTRMRHDVQQGLWVDDTSDHFPVIATLQLK